MSSDNNNNKRGEATPPPTTKMTYKEALKLHISEVNDPEWTDVCPVCAKFSGDRIQIFSHLLTRHGLNCGHPNGIVNAHELIATIRSKFDSLICLYCEGTFPSQAVLRKHMKHRKHYRISRVNSAYDQFYLSNYHPKNQCENYTHPSYLQHKTEFLSSNSSSSISEDEGEYECPNGDDDDDDDEADNVTFDDFTSPTPTKCLFCPVTCDEPLLLMGHCEKVHEFVFEDIIKVLSLDFYGGIKFVNYVRSCVNENKCIFCDFKGSTNTELQEHFNLSKHLNLSLFTENPAHPWDDDKYLIPENCNDPILYCLGQFGCIFDD